MTATEDAIPADIAALSFEAALKQLEDIVAKLEHGDVPLEDSIRHYERGEALKAHCDGLLRTAEERVRVIQLRADGTPRGTAPLDEG